MNRTFAGLTLALGTVAAAAAVAFAQSPAPPPQDAVVAEIRALRNDLNERLEATIRTQLLVARLSLQEQRISTAARQLMDVEGKLRENESTRAQLEQGMKMFGAELEKQKPDADAPDFLLGPLKSGMERVAKTESDLRAQQAELQRLIAEEQARWTAFSQKLDELEKSLTMVKR